MFWINPYSQRNQRHRWLGQRKDPRSPAPVQELSHTFAEYLEIRRELDELKHALARRRAAHQRAVEEARVTSDLAFDRFVRTFERYVAQQKAGYNPDQPRVPAGSSEGGRWTTGNSGAEKPHRIRVAADITGFTKHGINRAISRGISPASLHDAVVNPLQILPQANGTTQYVGRDAVVVLNPLGRVVTTWPQ